MKRLITYSVVFLLFFGLNQSTHAQNLALSGIITFEKKENMHKQFTEQNSWTEERLKHMPKYKTDEFKLSFNTHKSIYKMSVEDESPQFTWMKVANANTVLIDFDSKKYEAEKVIYDKTYKVEDSLPALQWKMLGEYRNIAGYNCRKASTIIMDSIYVIAFYTDEIPVNGGPESFNGLPGMILGIALPRLNMTYFATKVETQLIPETTFVFPKTKAKKTTFKAFNDELGLALKDWGEYASKVLWKANL